MWLFYVMFWWLVGLLYLCVDFLLLLLYWLILLIELNKSWGLLLMGWLLKFLFLLRKLLLFLNIVIINLNIYLTTGLNLAHNVFVFHHYIVKTALGSLLPSNILILTLRTMILIFCKILHIIFLFPCHTCLWHRYLLNVPLLLLALLLRHFVQLKSACSIILWRSWCLWLQMLFKLTVVFRWYRWCESL